LHLGLKKFHFSWCSAGFWGVELLAQGLLLVKGFVVAVFFLVVAVEILWWSAAMDGSTQDGIWRVSE